MNHCRCRHAYSCNTRWYCVSFQLLWIINAGSLSNSDKKNKKTKKKIYYNKWKRQTEEETLCKSVIAKFNKSRYMTKKSGLCFFVFFAIVSLCAHNMVAREYLIQSANDFIDHNYHKLTASVYVNVLLAFTFWHIAIKTAVIRALQQYLHHTFKYTLHKVYILYCVSVLCPLFSLTSAWSDNFFWKIQMIFFAKWLAFCIF